MTSNHLRKTLKIKKKYIMINDILFVQYFP